MRFINAPKMMIAVTGLNHAVLYVRELERSLHFYQSVLGLEEVAQIQGKMAFLRAKGSQNHHDLGLIALGANTPAPPPKTIGLYHLAWEVKTIEDLATAAQILQDHRYFRGSSDHGASKSIYGQDPDGYEFEITWQIPREEWGKFEQQAIVAPLNLRVELERYGDRQPSTTVG